jgi:hypothetical protein
MAGLIRKGELQAGIMHAVALKLPQQVMNQNTGGGTCWVWPASACDGDHVNYATSGNVYMGSLLAIPPDADLSGITDPAIRNIAIALRDYGGYVTDRGAELTFGGGFEGCVHYLAEFRDPETERIKGNYDQMGKISALLKVVANNSNEKRGGGGKPRVCLAPRLR